MHWHAMSYDTTRRFAVKLEIADEKMKSILAYLTDEVNSALKRRKIREINHFSPF